MPVKRDVETRLYSHLLAEQPVSLVSRRPRGRRRPFRFPDDLRTMPVVLPTLDSSIRVSFDLMMERASVRPIIAAEVDDMPMLRLVARESDSLTLLPAVVVQDELKSGTLVERHRISEISESFYAITPTRRVPHELVRRVVARS